MLSSMQGKDRTICVVCDMLVSRKSHFKSTFKGKDYFFCCDECKSAFDQNPYNYTLG